jgi:hypothetical protein
LARGAHNHYACAIECINIALNDAYALRVLFLSPSSKYVLDLYLDVARGRWFVVELNPFSTSSSGHCFRYFDPRDAATLDKGPFQLRLHSRTGPARPPAPPCVRPCVRALCSRVTVLVWLLSSTNAVLSFTSSSESETTYFFF